MTPAVETKRDTEREKLLLVKETRGQIGEAQTFITSATLMTCFQRV